MIGYEPAKPITQAPAWLTELCNAPAAALSAGTTGVAPQFLAEGRRNTDLTSVAGFLRSKGLTTERIEPVLQTLNSTLSVPLPADEVTKIADSIMRYGMNIKLDELFVTDVLVNLFRGQIRHCSATGWMLYGNRGIWEPDDSAKFVTQIAKTIVEEFCSYAETLNVDGKPLFSTKTIASVKRLAFLSNILRLASGHPSITAHITDFDADATLLSFENGTLDLVTRQLREHRAVDLITRQFPITFDSAATCPTFDRFLSDILPVENANFVLRILAYALTGTGKEQCFVIFHGKGRNGKSTLVNLIVKLFGISAITAEPTSFLKKTGSGASNDIARLAKALLAITSELPPGAVLDTPLVKRLTGQDTITARFLYQEYFEFQPRFLLLMVTNFMPVIEGSDSAVARRVLAVPFDHVISASSIDQTLDQKLWQERAGILNRLLDALMVYNTRGLAPPESVMAKTKAFLDDTNLLKRFVDQNCELLADSKSSVSAVYNRFSCFSIAEGIKPMSQRSFSQQLEQAYSLAKKRTAVGMEWVGLGLTHG